MVIIFSSEELEKAKTQKEKKPLLKSEKSTAGYPHVHRLPQPSQPEETETPSIGNFSLPVLKLIQKYQDYYLDLQSEIEVATIHVDEIASKVAFFYEKIRKIVDWKEEHLVRRAAIERILKRKMISEISGFNLASDIKPEIVAEPLVLELIRGGHFPNDKIPRMKIDEVQRVLEKYTYILKNNSLTKNNQLSPQVKKKVNFYNWLLEIAACEIEEVIEPPLREKALIEFMASSLIERIRVVPDTALTEEEERTQIYIAVHRTLFHLDSPIISYHLLKRRWSQWGNLPPSQLAEVAQNIFMIREEIRKDLSRPFSSHFYRICEKYDTLFLIFGDILDSFARNPLEISNKISKSKNLVSSIKKAYNKRLSTLKKRLFRAAIYSTLSIFIASGLSLFIVEVPLAELFYGQFNFVAMTVDVLLPTFLMYGLVAMVKPPRKTNLKRVIKEIKKVVYQQEETDVYEIRIRKKRGPIINFIVSLLYLLGTILSLSLVFWVFHLANIPITSLYIDTLNIAVIVFAALVIRQRAKELTVEEKGSFWEFIIDILSVPLAKIGQWLANKWKEYNLVSVFFTALIDMPFTTFVEFIENWSSFLKEKKAEIH